MHYIIEYDTKKIITNLTKWQIEDICKKTEIKIRAVFSEEKDQISEEIFKFIPTNRRSYNLIILC